MGTKHQGTSSERRALDAYIKLSRAASAVETRINRHLADVGLSISQFGVLEAIYHLGPMHQGELARKILKTSGNLTVVIENLVKRGLVERRRNEADRRYILVLLTDKGRDLIESFFPRHVARVEATFGELTAEEQATLARLCRKLGVGSGTDLSTDLSTDVGTDFGTVSGGPAPEDNTDQAARRTAHPRTEHAS